MADGYPQPVGTAVWVAVGLAGGFGDRRLCHWGDAEGALIR